MSKTAFAGIGAFAGAVGFLAASIWHGTQGQPLPSPAVSAPAAIKAASSVQRVASLVQIGPGATAAKSSSTSTERKSTDSLPAAHRSQDAGPTDRRSTTINRPAERRYSRRYRKRKYRKSWNDRQYRRYARDRFLDSRYDRHRFYKRDRWRPRRNRNYRQRGYDRYTRPRRTRRYFVSRNYDRRYYNRYWRYRGQRYKQARRYRPFAERRYRYRNYDRYARRGSKRYGWSKRRENLTIPTAKSSQDKITREPASSISAAPLLKCSPGKNIAQGNRSQSPANAPPRSGDKNNGGLGWLQPDSGRSI